jgi:hypothetical protein
VLPGSHATWILFADRSVQDTDTEAVEPTDFRVQWTFSIEGCFIGTDATASDARPNAEWIG